LALGPFLKLDPVLTVASIGAASVYAGHHKLWLHLFCFPARVPSATCVPMGKREHIGTQEKKHHPQETT